MGAIPVLPLRQLFQNDSLPTPQAEIMPIPVTTISSECGVRNAEFGIVRFDLFSGILILHSNLEKTNESWLYTGQVKADLLRGWF
jgi:hypothetical protein